MGILKLFAKPPPVVGRLPVGSMTIDRNGCILATTIGSAHRHELLQEIADDILELFREAHRAQLPLSELIFQFAGLQITACELRGGALVFLTPKT